MKKVLWIIGLLAAALAAANGRAQPFVGLNASYASITADGFSDGTHWGPDLEAGYRFGTAITHAIKVSYQTYRWNSVTELQLPPMPDGPYYLRSNLDFHFEVLQLAYELNWPLAGGTVQAFFSPGAGAVRIKGEGISHYVGGLLPGTSWDIFSNVGSSWRFALQGTAGLRWQVAKAWNVCVGYGYLYRKAELLTPYPPDPGADRHTEVSRWLIGVSYRR